MWMRKLELEGKNLQQFEVILANGEIPLLEVSSHGSGANCSVRIVPWTTKRPYAAISHVWTDGLGNPEATALPQCQIRFLYDAVVDTGIQDGDTGNVLLWCDTICCPVEPPEEKALVISRMREIYAKAECVLVLDAELQKLRAREMDRLEIFTRTFHSRWMQRLWTLQEGLLAKTLWIRYADATRTLDEIEDMKPESARICEFAILHFVRIHYRTLRRLLGKDNWTENSLLQLSWALKERKVSMIQDEPLCLATIFRLEKEQIREIAMVSGDHRDSEENRIKVRDERMALLWKTLENRKTTIPKGLLFHYGSRLQLKGIRWAPASLLDAFQDDTIVPAATWSSDSAGSITSSGLNLESPGVLIQRRSPDKILQEYWRFPLDSGVYQESCPLRDAESRWYFLQGSARPAAVEKHNFDGILRLQNDDELSTWYTTRLREAKLPSVRQIILRASSSKHDTGLLFAHREQPNFATWNRAFAILLDNFEEDVGSFRGEGCRLVTIGLDKQVDKCKIWEFILGIVQNVQKTDVYAAYLQVGADVRVANSEGVAPTTGSHPRQSSKKMAPNTASMLRASLLQLDQTLEATIAYALGKDGEMKRFIETHWEGTAAPLAVLLFARQMLADDFFFDIRFLPDRSNWYID